MEALYDWLDQGGAYFANVRVDHGEHGARGVFIKPGCSVRAGEALIRIPLKFIITNALAAASPIGQRICRASDWQPSLSFNHNLLACFLLQEKRKKRCSFFWPWIELLPCLEDLGRIPVTWTEEKLAWLEGSQVFAFVSKQKSEWNRDFQCLGISSEFSFEEYLWARTIASTRTYSVFIQGRRLSAMVPLADMLNHSSSMARMARWAFDAVSESFLICSCQPEIEGPQEVFINYGGKASHRMFSWYGFCTDTGIDPPASKIDVNVRSSVFPLAPEPDQFVQDLGVIARYVRNKLSRSEANLISSKGNMTNVLLLEIEVFRYLQECVFAQIKAFPRSLEEDLAELGDNPDLDIDRRNALMVLVSEKKMLRYTLEFLLYVCEIFKRQLKDHRILDSCLESFDGLEVEKCDADSYWEDLICKEDSLKQLLRACTECPGLTTFGNDFGIAIKDLFYLYCVSEFVPLFRSGLASKEKDQEIDEKVLVEATAESESQVIPKLTSRHRRSRSFLCYCKRSE
jgi:hypothetical protein